MTCKCVQEMLSALLDNELACEDLAAVKAHLDRCPCCQAEETQLRILKNLLSSSPCAEPPAGFESRLFETVLAAETRTTVTWRRSIPLMAGVAAAAATITFLVLNLTQQSGPSGNNPEQMMALEIHRDETTMAGADPYFGAPTVVPAHYGRN